MGKESKWQFEGIFLFFLENRFKHFMQIVSNRDNLTEMSNPSLAVENSVKPSFVAEDKKTCKTNLTKIYFTDRI